MISWGWGGARAGHDTAYWSECVSLTRSPGTVPGLPGGCVEPWLRTASARVGCMCWLGSWRRGLSWATAAVEPRLRPGGDA